MSKRPQRGRFSQLDRSFHLHAKLSLQRNICITSPAFAGTPRRLPRDRRSAAGTRARAARARRFSPSNYDCSGPDAPRVPEGRQPAAGLAAAVHRGRAPACSAGPARRPALPRHGSDRSRDHPPRDAVHGQRQDRRGALHRRLRCGYSPRRGTTASWFRSPPARARRRTGRDPLVSIGRRGVPTCPARYRCAVPPDSPASTTPVQDYLDRAVPGASADYLVIPRALAQSMPLRWQQVFVGLLTDLHDAYGHLTWPEYRVVPSRWEIVSDLDEGAARRRGHSRRPRAGRRSGVPRHRRAPDHRPQRHRVLAPVEDPLPLPSAGHVDARPAKPL